MSSSYFDYKSFAFREIAEKIERDIARALKERPEMTHEDYWVIEVHDSMSSYHHIGGYMQFESCKEAEDFLLLRNAVKAERDWGIKIQNASDIVYQSMDKIMKGTPDDTSIPVLYVIHHCVFDHYPNDANVLELKTETIEILKKAYKQIRIAEIYADCSGDLLDGDEVEDDVQGRLDEYLQKLERELKNKDWQTPYDGWEEE